MFDAKLNEAIGKAAGGGTPDLGVLDEMEPGPFLAIVLSGINLDTLTGEERISVMQARQRMASHYAAQTYEAMASVVDAYEREEPCDHPSACEATAYELRAALQMTRRFADIELSFALDLRDRLPSVFTALSQGLIDQRRARTIVWQTTHLDDDTARAVTDRIIDQAPGLTTGQLMSRIRKLCIQVAPEQAASRYDRAVQERRLVAEPTTDGTASLAGFDLPPHKVAAAMRHINAIAKSLHEPDEPRCMNQLRADIYLDLLVGTDNGGKGGTVDIRVDLNTLTELTDNPGELGGYGPVIADIARRITKDHDRAQWRYTVTDNGRPIATGTTRRRPTASQRRLIEASHTSCSFPGCRMPATDCDLDHIIDWSHGGPTTIENLAPLCRHDHTGKHQHNWTYQTNPDGDIEWTSPLGRRYVIRGPSP